MTQTWNDDGTLASVEDWNSKTVTFGYDANANLTGITDPSTTNVTDTFGFNAADQMTSVSSSNGSTLFSATYTRDGNGQLSSDSSQAANQQNYKYTSLNQLCYAGSSTSSGCSSPPSNSYPYGFDSADNLTTIENAGHTAANAQQFNDADELCWVLPSGTSANSCGTTPTGGTTYSYDDRGNQTGHVLASGAGTCDTYDQVNRLTAIKTGTGSSCTSPTTVGTYAYDGDGVRASKTVSGTTTHFTWDGAGGALLQEKAGSTKTSYTYGPGGAPVEQIVGSTTTYLHHDQIGSTRLITDSAGATGTATTLTFDPYGNSVSTSGSLTTNLQFQGQYLDSESGLYQLRTRYYDSATAQFLTRDSLVATTRSPYTYVSSDSLNGTDPTGLCDVNPFSSDWCGRQVFQHPSEAAQVAGKDTLRGIVSSTPVVGSWVGTGHTAGICATASAGIGLGGTASGCFAVSNTDFGFTGTVGGGADLPGSADVGIGPMFSDAPCVSQLGGPFQYGGASVGEGVSTNAEIGGAGGTHYVWVGPGFGVQLPIPVAVWGGATNTWTKTWSY